MPPETAAKQPTNETRPRRAYLKADERRRLIVEAAQQVFARSNLQGARTRDIAKAADVNEATLFQHFPSKEALFQAAVIEPLLETMQGMDERARIYEAARSNEEAEELARASTAEHLQSVIKIFPLLLSALASDPELGRRIYQEQLAPLLHRRGQAMRNTIKPDLDPDMVATAIFGAFFAIAMDQAFGKGRKDMKKTAEQVGKMLISGFRRDVEDQVA
jgi:TetR/AcrR family transcriptional regulator